MADIFKYDKRREEIGKRIKDERTKRGLTQSGLAVRVSTTEGNNTTIGQSTVASWEKGITIPPLGRLIILSHIFECDIAYLLGDIECKTWEQTDAVRYTGLSPEAVKALHMEKEASSEFENRYGGSGSLKLISYIVQKMNLRDVSTEMYSAMKTECDGRTNTIQTGGIKAIVSDEEIGISRYQDGRIMLPPHESRKFILSKLLKELQEIVDNGLNNIHIECSVLYFSDLLKNAAYNAADIKDDDD